MAIADGHLYSTMSIQSTNQQHCLAASKHVYMQPHAYYTSLPTFGIELSSQKLLCRMVCVQLYRLMQLQYPVSFYARR